MADKYGNPAYMLLADDKLQGATVIIPSTGSGYPVLYDSSEYPADNILDERISKPTIIIPDVLLTTYVDIKLDCRGLGIKYTNIDFIAFFWSNARYSRVMLNTSASVPGKPTQFGGTDNTWLDFDGVGVWFDRFDLDEFEQELWPNWYIVYGAGSLLADINWLWIRLHTPMVTTNVIWLGKVVVGKSTSFSRRPQYPISRKTEFTGPRLRTEEGQFWTGRRIPRRFVSFPVDHMTQTQLDEWNNLLYRSHGGYTSFLFFEDFDGMLLHSSYAVDICRFDNKNTVKEKIGAYSDTQRNYNTEFKLSIEPIGVIDLD